MQINFNITTNTPFFGSKVVYRAVKYSDIKQVPTHCGCCGREVINSTMWDKTGKKIAKPLSVLLKQGCFESFRTKYDKLYEYIVELAANNPKKNLDQILSKNPDVLRQCSQLIFKGVDLSKLDRKEARKQGAEGTQTYYRLRRKGRAELAGSATTMKTFAPYKKYLQGEKLITFEQLERYADKYPRKTISEIINMPEIYEFHYAMTLLRNAEMREKRDYHFHRILELVKKENPNAVEIFEELKTQGIELIAAERDCKARIPKLKELYAQHLEENGCSKIKEQVMTELENIPTTFITKDSFLAYAKEHQYNDIAIMESLFNPLISSEEHMKAISHDGTDYIGNRVVFCRECNQTRDNIPYTEFIKYHPDMQQNMQQQVDEISRLILAGKLDSRYDFWPNKVAEILSEESGGQIKLDVSEFTEKFKKKTKREMKRAERERKALEEEKAELKASLKDKEKECKEATDRYNEAAKTYEKFLKLIGKIS